MPSEPLDLRSALRQLFKPDVQVASGPELLKPNPLLLSVAEAEFFRVLTEATRETYYAFPKVLIHDVLIPKRPDEWMGLKTKRIAQHIDFVLCSIESFAVIAVIILHDPNEDLKSKLLPDDTVLNLIRSVEMPCIHFVSGQEYVADDVRRSIAIGIRRNGAGDDGYEIGPVPTCPNCEVPMTQRVARAGDLAGELVWGCPNFPKCREIIPIKSFDSAQ